MHDLLGKPLAPGDIITYNVDWDGLAVGIVYKADADWITFHDDHNGRQRVQPKHCALLDSTHRGQHFATIQNRLAQRRISDRAIPHDVIKQPLAINDIVVFSNFVAGRALTLGRVAAILPLNSELPHGAQIKVHSFQKGGTKTYGSDAHQVGLVMTPYINISDALLHDLLKDVGT